MMKVSDLKGNELDYWVAKASGFSAQIVHDTNDPLCLVDDGVLKYGDGEPFIYPFNPSTRWDMAGPIIEREKISVQHDVEDYSEPDEPWYAECGVFWDLGPTPLIAAMRSFVKSKFGNEVPDEGK